VWSETCHRAPKLGVWLTREVTFAPLIYVSQGTLGGDESEQFWTPEIAPQTRDWPEKRHQKCDESEQFGTPEIAPQTWDWLEKRHQKCDESEQFGTPEIAPQTRDWLEKRHRNQRKINGKSMEK